MPVSVENRVWKKVDKKTGDERIMNYMESKMCAMQKGWCFPCGRPTHKDRFMGTLRIPLDNEDVYSGICIECHPNQVPDYVLEAWRKSHGIGERPEQPIDIPVEPESEPVIEEPEPESESEPEPVVEEPEPEPEPVVEEPETEPIVQGPMTDWRKAWVRS